MYDQVCSCSVLTFYSLFLTYICVSVLWTGDLYLFCKGADSSIFPRVISGKVDQVRARVEHNAVVRTHRITLTFPNILVLSQAIISIVGTGCRSVEHHPPPLLFPVFCLWCLQCRFYSNTVHFQWYFPHISNLTKYIIVCFIVALLLQPLWWLFTTFEVVVSFSRKVHTIQMK